jgi:FKBP-type peptidyl-prolyl cis-trans isomerase SlyD
MQAKHGAVVTMDYTLTDDEGNVLDKTEEPIEYLHGYGTIIPGLEKGLEGAEPGNERQIVVEPGEAYGEPDPKAVFEVSRDSVPDDMALEPGMRVVGDTSDGPVGLVVREVNKDHIVVDANHPLAGKTLHFDVKVVDVRQASDEELAEASEDEESPGAAAPG